jgi:TPR repeat protein
MTEKDADNYYYDGAAYFYATGRKKNYVKAYKNLILAATFGIQHAQNLIGQCYFYGLGVKKSAKNAFAWYKKAALSNSKLKILKEHKRVALCNLAIMYDKGTGTPENPELAFKYYKMSAELGDMDAQCNLGVMFHSGRGTQLDHKLAILWTKKAAIKGDSIAQYNLALAYRFGEGKEKSKRYEKIWLQKAANGGHKRAAVEFKKILGKR